MRRPKPKRLFVCSMCGALVTLAPAAGVPARCDLCKARLNRDRYQPIAKKRLRGGIGR